MKIYLLSLLTLLLWTRVPAQVSSTQIAELGGRFYPAAFSGWQASTITPVLAPGLATVIVNPSQVSLVGNGSIAPVITGVPVEVQDGSNSEIITPTAVTCGSSSCSMTAAFTYPHPGGFRLTSANFGLNEAIASAAAQGGGTVVVSNLWDGSTAQLVGAAGAMNVAVEDLRAGNDLRYVWTGTSYAPVERVIHADLLDWSEPVASAVAAGNLVTITPPWPALPLGVASGALSYVSTTSGSPNVTWVAGDKFNPNWAAGKSVSLNGAAMTISSCSSATACTLSANASAMGSHVLMVVGQPTSAYISGGTGTAEAFDILGIGASECPGGTALSVCGTLANSHSGTWTIASATDGIQEAVNSAESAITRSARVVHIPASSTLTTTNTFPAGPGLPCWITYAPIVVSGSAISLAGDGANATHICNTGAGAAIMELNVVGNSARDLYVSGNATTSGPDFEWYNGPGGSGVDSMTRVMADGAAGTFTDPLGTSEASAGIWVMGAEQFGIDHSDATSNNRGISFAENPSGNGTAITITDTTASANAGDGIDIGIGSFAVEGCSVIGGRVYHNGGAGINMACDGGKIAGVYMEGNVPDIVLAPGSTGISVTGNELSQLASSSTAIIKAGSAAAPWDFSTGDTITGNNFVIQMPSGSQTLTAMVDGWFLGTTIGPNTYDYYSTTTPLTLANGVVLENTNISGIVGPYANNIVRASSYGPASQYNSSGRLTVTNGVDDLTLGVTVATVSHDYSQAVHMLASGASPASAGGAVLGSSALPWASLYLGNSNGYAVLMPASSPGNVDITLPATTGTVALASQLPLTATTADIGGSALGAGACTSATLAVAGTATNMAVAASPQTDPGAGFSWQAWVSAAGTVTVRVCNDTSGSLTPAATPYNVRVFP
ncbi:MAG: hypothetical protein EPN33_03540 [Acidobacteria bacterium]|nr:MAG: hypothetical protein EPN33_03540 [Acidobacteriota bacterium]